MPHLTTSLPNIWLVDENGQRHKFHDLIRNQTVVLNMFYSNCQIKCIPLGGLMCRVNLLLQPYIEKEDIRFISITLDAENDTASDIAGFKGKVHTDKCRNWHFYTGNYKEIEVLRRKLGMYSPEPDIDAIKANHSGHFLVFNEKTGFRKHTQAFDNPIDIARKTVQLLTKNFYRHSYDLKDMQFDALTDKQLFANIHTMNAMFTVPFLPEDIKLKYDQQAELQRGFQYDPLEMLNSDGSTENAKTQCCCCCKK